MIDSARGLLPEARAELRQERAQYGIAPLPCLTDLLGNLGAGSTMRRLDELLPHRRRMPEGTAPAQSDS